MPGIKPDVSQPGYNPEVLTKSDPVVKVRIVSKLIAFLEGQPVGYKQELAKALEIEPSYLSRKLSGDRAFTAKDCIAIEKFTRGELRCEDILPDLDWAYLRGSCDRCLLKWEPKRAS